MANLPPSPVSKSFLVCRRIVQDAATGEFVIISPIHEIHSATYPTLVELAIFARWGSVQGKYQLEIRLQDLEENVAWGQRQPVPLECTDPLVIVMLALHPLKVYFPRPGKHEFVLLANGQEVVRDIFWAHQGNSRIS